MTRELTEKLLKSFQRYDEYRTTLNYFMPIEFDGKKYCVATSAHHFIMIPETEENKVDPPTEKCVNFAGILPSLNLNIEFPANKLLDSFGAIQIVERDITEECPSCDRDGKFEHYGFDYDCEYCDGEGFIKTGKKETVKDPDARIVINKKRFKAEFIKDIIDVVQETSGEFLSIRYSSQMTILKLDESILFGIMECVGESEGTNIIVI